jgi:hypothetical protein
MPNAKVIMIITTPMPIEVLVDLGRHPRMPMTRNSAAIEMAPMRYMNRRLRR